MANPDNDRYLGEPSEIPPPSHTPFVTALECFEQASFYFRRAVLSGHVEAKILAAAGDIAGASRVVDVVVSCQQAAETADKMAELEKARLSNGG